MATKNIFAGLGVKTTFVNILYEELMKREYVTLADVMCIKRRKPKGFYAHNPIATLSREKFYGDLKKASSELIKTLETVYPGCIEYNGKNGKGKAFRYIGESDDPLAAERQAIGQKRLEDYVAFCKASAGILPYSWFSAFFENTQLLLDTNRDIENGAGHIRSSLEQNLKNIDLLPAINKAITDHQVLRFSYQPFGQAPFELIFHPQYLKEYNGRWFVFGDANREPFKAYNVPLDRIVGNLSTVDDVEYIPAPKGFYQQFFKNIIGVTHEKDAKVETVVIRTKTEYQHGLMLTKPLHHSQKETLPFGEYKDGCYGEITLTIEPNRELRGRIMLYGENLEVVQPLSLREQMKDIIKQQKDIYFDEKK
ncbi:MAG: WYL domain-containing protein [Prevotella sp.]|nr:WYL domain-containing protein [Prevotella sp.]